MIKYNLIEKTKYFQLRYTWTRNISWDNKEALYDFIKWYNKTGDCKIIYITYNNNIFIKL